MLNSTASTHAYLVTYTKDVQTMRLLRFNSAVDTIVKPNIAVIRKIQNNDFERHCLSGRDFLMATRACFGPIGGGTVGSASSGAANGQFTVWGHMSSKMGQWPVSQSRVTSR